MKENLLENLLKTTYTTLRIQNSACEFQVLQSVREGKKYLIIPTDEWDIEDRIILENGTALIPEQDYASSLPEELK